MNDSTRREMLEESRVAHLPSMSPASPREMRDVAMREAAFGPGQPVDASTMISSGLQRDLANRRVVMLTKDAETGDQVQAALEAQGVAVQRATAEGRLRTEDRNGQPLLRTGEVVVVTGGDYEAMIASQMHASLRAVDAINTALVRSSGGSTDDIVLAVTSEDAMRDANSTLNILIDRMVEANMVDVQGGPGGMPAWMRDGLTWLGGSDSKRFSKPTGHAGRIAAILAPPSGSMGGARRIDTLDMETTDGRTLHDVHDVHYGETSGYDAAGAFDGIPESSEADRQAWIQLLSDRHIAAEGTTDGAQSTGDRFGHARMAFSDETMDGIFGDDVIARERERRRSIILTDDHAMRDVGMVLAKASLPQSRFDAGAANQAFNMKRGRAGRGTPGKRGGGRK